MLAWRAFGYAAGFAKTPPPECIASLEAALAQEFERWEKMFGSIPAGAPDMARPENHNRRAVL